MTNVLQASKGKAVIYACGGTGTNIGKKLEQFRNVSETGMADLNIVYIDTSKSNLSETVPKEHCYLFDGLDGSGGIRKDNHKAISDNTRKIIQAFPPQDINIVISSGGGGSGSVIAPSIVSELISKDIPVVTIIIGSTDTRTFVTNTLNTLKSYENVSNKRNRPVIAAYFQNSRETPRHKVDEAVIAVILSITTVFSRENAELDTRDLFNFLYYDRPTSFKPQLAHLSVTVGNVPSDISDNVITIATVAVEGADTSLDFTPEYQCIGYLPANAPSDVLKNSPIHLIIHNDVFSDVSRDLETRKETLLVAEQARVPTKSILSDDDIATDDGLIV